jgi:glucan biosynthesis protein
MNNIRSRLFLRVDEEKTSISPMESIFSEARSQRKDPRLYHPFYEARDGTYILIMNVFITNQSA